jgi:DNA-binding GntR family transcriptional regulator
MSIGSYADPKTYLMVKDNLAATLREEIVSGRLSPGEKIVEGRWATKLGVAQASVREALNILVSEGFVQKGSGRSAEVTQLTDEDVVQIYQVRAVLEGLAARLAAQKQPDLRELEQILADMRSAADCRNVRAFYERDLRFHLLIAEKCGNRFLVQQLTRLMVPLFAFVVMRVRGATDDPEHFRRSIEQHRTIVEALRSGDPYFAQNQTSRTIEQFLAGTHDVLMRRKAEPEPRPSD